ncbi:MAG: ABC transporter ATP-binding protein [Acidobacteriota bacterium]|nr:ABC transporter ATP-binding protein [Acidobacteriota bacterium]
MEAIIEVRDLTRLFGRFAAVDNVSFKVHAGEIVGFLGPNGAGKTTTIKMILGLLRITSGSVRVRGLDSVRQRQKIKAVTGYMSQKFSLYPLLTVLENVTFFGGISGLSRKELAALRNDIAARLPAGAADRRVESLPPGFRQEVALFVSLMTDPEILILDEPTSGVDPQTRRRFWDRIYDLKQAGKTILVTTHNLDEAEYADRVLIMHQGRLLLDGQPKTLLQAGQAESIETLFREVIARNETH